MTVLDALVLAVNRWRELHYDYDCDDAVFYMSPTVAAEIDGWLFVATLGRVVISKDVARLWAVLPSYVLEWGESGPRTVKEPEAWLRWGGPFNEVGGWFPPALAPAGWS